MVKDNLLSLKNRNIVRLTKESQQANLQMNATKASPHQTKKPVKLATSKIFTDLQYKFSGRQQEMTNFIEAEVKSRTEELYRKAHFDALTHLPNRAHFKDLINQVLLKAKETETTFTLLFLDLDGFKAVNDTFGHHIGDELLKHACARLVSSVRKDDIVARLGGDELVVLLTDTDDTRKCIEKISTNIIKDISRPYYLEENEVEVSTSIGISFYPQDGKTSNEIMKHADKALYIAKHNGKKQFRFYEDISTETNKPDITKTVNTAIKNNTLFAYVDPQINLLENKIVGATITPTWPSDDFKDSTNKNWLDLLTDNEQKSTINRWLFDSACFYLNQWQQKNTEFILTVPVTKTLLLQKNIASSLHKRMIHFGVSKNQLQLSISLSELNTELTGTLNALISQGFQITLTDLGLENLDINLLSSLKIQEFSFNAEWLQKQMKSPQSQQWVKALIQMTKSLDASIIATGIESEKTYLTLKNWGCEIGQGTFWSKEILSENFENLIA